MAESPTTSAAPSQKRPLEEPSSPTGPGEQPDAKRPALDKVIKSGTSAENSTQETPASKEIAESVTKTEKKPEAVENGSSEPITTIATTTTEASTAIATHPPMNGTAVTPATNVDESQWLHVRSIISSAEAATVIGKGGENVTLIRKHSGAKCTVSDYSRGAVERILTVSGPVDAVAKAFGLIIRTLNNEPLEESSTPQSKTYPLRLLIPHVLIGSIIGKAGVRIREIQEASGARLNASEGTLPLSTERSLVVLGVADAVHIATYYVGSTLVEQLTERFGGPAASAYATRSGQPAGAVPGGLQVVPYVPQAAGGQWAHPDVFRRHTNAGHRTPSNPYGVAYLHGPSPPQAHHPPQGGMPYGMGSPRAAPYPAPVGHHQQPPQPAYGQHAPHPAHAHAGPAPTAHPAAPHQPTTPSAVPGQPLTQQIYIPNDMVGAIIGKGGQKINEIRTLSGSVIKINEPQENSNDRLVTITGTPDQNQMALYMLYTRLESEKHRA